MKTGWKSSIAMIVKILVILILPLILFRYVDSQPAAVVNEAPEEAVRSIAIVNEDNGYVLNDEVVTLSSEVPLLLNEQTDYNWTVVNRSSAEQGLNSKTYDAVIYIPSGFSENIMSFNQKSPETAAINFVIQPTLDAKNRQRVQKEMAIAKNNINREMSTIYWSYVSQEIEFIREQFDNILEKEIDFQNAMYSFYAPSSRTLAQEIEQHKNGLENILSQTENIDEQSQNSVDVASEAEERITSIAEAIEDYKVYQQEKQQTVELFLEENRKTIDEEVVKYNDLLDEKKEERDKQLNELRNSIKDIDKSNDDLIASFTNTNEKGSQTIKDWVAWESENSYFYDTLNEEILRIVSSHNEESLKIAYEKMKEDIDTLIGAPINIEIGQLINPEINNVSFEDFIVLIEQLESQVGNNVETAKVNTKDSESQSGEIADNSMSDASIQNELANGDEQVTWDQVYEQINSLSTQVNGALADWETHVEDLNNILATISDISKNNTASIIKNIESKQGNILELVNNDRKVVLKEKFGSLGDISNKSIVALYQYSDSLTEYKTTLTQKSIVNSDIIEQINALEIEKQMEILFHKVNTNYTNGLRDIFGVTQEEIEATKTANKSFDEILKEVTDSFASFESLITNEQENTTNIFDAVRENADTLTVNLRETNSQPLEYEEFPQTSLGLLDGQMVVNIHDSTLSGLQQLSESVASLDESQENITSSTSELQTMVGEVQQRSDDLNTRWATNVNSTELVRGDVHGVLANTFVDGQENPFVYNHLANPVNVEGKTGGQVLSETENRLPPVIMLIAILISGLLIGFISQFYSNSNYYVQSGLFILLNLAVGLIISIYGLNIYNLGDAVSIQWSLFTILLLFATSNIVRAGLFINTFVGWLAGIALIVFFITPMIDIVVPDFNFNNPIANAYMGLQYGMDSPYVLTMVILGIITLLVSVFIYTLQVMRKKPKVVQDEKAAA